MEGWGGKVAVGEESVDKGREGRERGGEEENKQGGEKRKEERREVGETNEGEI